MALGPPDLSDILGSTAKSNAPRVIRQILRRAAEDIFTEYNPVELERLIDDDYPLVEEEIPPGVKQTLREIGPEFEDTIYREVRGENIKYWLANPGWVDDPMVAAQLQECHRIIEEHPEGDAWLEDQVADIWSYTLNYPDS